MLSSELLETLHGLKRSDKLCVIRLLADDLALEEESLLTQGASYEVGSPYESAGAAETLLKLLEEDHEHHD